MDGGLLAIDPAYFTITGGRERWLYRVARKHAGGSGPEGFAISLPTLFEKSGAEGTYRRFKFEIQAVIRRNNLPGFDLTLEFGKSEPSLRMARRTEAGRGEPAPRPQPKAAISPAESQPSLFGVLTEETISRVRHDFPGWDVYGLKAEFDAWLGQVPERAPDDYQKAFHGFGPAASHPQPGVGSG